MICKTLLVFTLLSGLAALQAAAQEGKPPLPKDVFADAIAWSMADLNAVKLRGAVKLGTELTGKERESSLARGGDGKVAEFAGGFLDAGNDARLNLHGETMTLLLRLRPATTEWPEGELFAKGGGHDRLVFNLYSHAGKIGFEYGAEGQTGLAGSVSVATQLLKPESWHDVVVRYDGSSLVMFLDGLVVGRTQAKGSLRQGNTEPVTIGRALRGQVDHAALWQRALSDREIVAVSGGEQAVKPQREAFAKSVEAKIGREDLTLNDQLRATRELRAKLWADPARPRYHLLPPEASWNDINGTIFWKGRYHVFFLGRSAPDRETILSGKDTPNFRETWLHASSTDLVHWIHHPPAMVPTFDGSMPSGLYSGDAINDAPVPTLMYHVPGQGTCISTAEDDELIHWKPHPKNPVIPSAGAPAEAVIFDTSAWREGDVYYALVGNKNKRPGFEGDSTSLFRSRDLANWEYRGPFYKSDRKWTLTAEDCACPDFFPIGNKHMLLMHTHRPVATCQYYIGTWDREHEQFIPETHGRMSWAGGQTSAPETLLDDKGRRIFWGWVREARPGRNGWASVATLPRVLSLGKDSTLRIEPAPELEVLRVNPRKHAALTIAPDSETKLADVTGECLELNIVFEPGEAREFGVKVRCSPDGAEETPITIAPAAKTLRTELAKSTLDPEVRYAGVDPKYAEANHVPDSEVHPKEQIAPFEIKPDEQVKLRIFIDRSIVEVFANGRQCLTQRIYPTRADSVGVSLFARGGMAKVKLIEAWDMSPTNSW